MKTSKPILLRDATIYDGTGVPPLRGDLLFRYGRIEAWGAQVEAPENAVVIPMEGRGVSPGWIDLHTHVFDGPGVFSVPPEAIGLSTGVTTLVDAGSAGALTFEPFARHTIARARERVLAYVNVVSAGLIHGHALEPGYVGDHFHPGLHTTCFAEALLAEFPDLMVGWKARLTRVLADHDAERERHAFETLLALRERTQLPVMVHHIESVIPPEELLRRLGARDVLTHLFHGVGGSIFDSATGRPLDEAWEARERGVLFDVGHGCGSFRWRVAERAVGDHGFLPDTISSDLHRYNLFHPVRDLATTMTRFLYLGLAPEMVIAMVTGRVLPALEVSPSPLLAPGAVADLTLFEREEGNFSLVDVEGETRTHRERFLPLAVVRKGELAPCYGFLTRASAGDAFEVKLQEALTL